MLGSLYRQAKEPRDRELISLGKTPSIAVSKKVGIGRGKPLKGKRTPLSRIRESSQH